MDEVSWTYSSAERQRSGEPLVFIKEVFRELTEHLLQVLRVPPYPYQGGYSGESEYRKNPPLSTDESQLPYLSN